MRHTQVHQVSLIILSVNCASGTTNNKLNQQRANVLLGSTTKGMICVTSIDCHPTHSDPNLNYELTLLACCHRDFAMNHCEAEKRTRET